MSREIQIEPKEIEFELESWEDVKVKDFDLLASGERKNHIFQKLGYEVLRSGELLDLKTKEKVKSKIGDEEFINVNKSPIALIAGSHNFIRNVAEYSELLAEKGDLKFATKKSSLDI